MRARGLTLVEMLVVLAISALAVALAFQALMQWRIAQQRIGTVERADREARLVEAWFRASMRALYATEDVAFEGTATRLSGSTLAPLATGQGRLQSQTWEIVDDTAGMALRLEEAPSTWQLPLPAGTVSARFIYGDAAGEQHERWPVELGLQTLLPATVALRMENADGRVRLWMSAILVAPGARTVPSEVLDEEL